MARMAEQAEERAVLLGTVQERQSVDNSSPYACKAGGSPVRRLCTYTRLRSSSSLVLLET